MYYERTFTVLSNRRAKTTDRNFLESSKTEMRVKCTEHLFPGNGQVVDPVTNPYVLVHMEKIKSSVTKVSGLKEVFISLCNQLVDHLLSLPDYLEGFDICSSLFRYQDVRCMCIDCY